jgi:electron transfer flavoprotein alpha/beta subunit
MSYTNEFAVKKEIEAQLIKIELRLPQIVSVSKYVELLQEKYILNQLLRQIKTTDESEILKSNINQ